MNFPQYFCDHLNKAKLLVSEGKIKDFPIAYSKENGFFEFIGVVKSDIEFIISNGDFEDISLTKREVLYGNNLYIYYKDCLESNVLEGIHLFCPLIFASLISKGSPFIIAHMAQTLDGKICTNCGNSKWIGNDENLIHAHRLRAMVDGVLVGGKTIANDLPRLNVRHVKGENPVRLLLSNTFCDFDKLPLVKGMKTFLLRRKDYKIEQSYSSIDKVIYYEGDTDQQRINDLLLKLKESGIDSILLEGGPKTVSSFFNERKINLLQLHIAPLIFGSGKSFIELSEIKNVSEGKKLNNVFYNKMGDGMMMTGELD